MIDFNIREADKQKATAIENHRWSTAAHCDAVATGLLIARKEVEGEIAAQTPKRKR